MKVKQGKLRHDLLGYESLEIHHPIPFKPAKGFAYVKQPDDSIGAVPDHEVDNWDDLPDLEAIDLNKIHPKSYPFSVIVRMNDYPF